MSNFNMSKLWLSKDGNYRDLNGNIVGSKKTGLTKEAQSYLASKYGKEYAARAGANMAAGHVYLNGSWRAFDKKTGFNSTANYQDALSRSKSNANEDIKVRGRYMFKDPITGKWTYYNQDAKNKAVTYDNQLKKLIKKSTPKEESFINRIGDAWHNMMNAPMGVVMLSNSGNGQMGTYTGSDGNPYIYNSTPKKELGLAAVMTAPLTLGYGLSSLPAATQLFTTTAGAGIGNYAGSYGAELLGGNENTQEMFGDLGGIVGGIYGASWKPAWAPKVKALEAPITPKQITSKPIISEEAPEFDPGVNWEASEVPVRTNTGLFYQGKPSDLAVVNKTGVTPNQTTALSIVRPRTKRLGFTGRSTYRFDRLLPESQSPTSLPDYIGYGNGLRLSWGTAKPSSGYTGGELKPELDLFGTEFKKGGKLIKRK